MHTSIAEFARAASDAVRSLKAFEARQSIRAGKMEVTARVRVLVPDRIVVEYATYTSALAEMDDLLGGHAEFSPDDLAGTSLFCDGHATWYVNPKLETALCSPGRRLYEPIPACDALGEVRFADDLARDFLLRDGGETTYSGRAARIVGLKPKRQRVSSLLRTTTFLAEKAELTIDAETYFPLHITFLPARSTPTSSLLGPGEWVTIEYSDVRCVDLPESTFTPALPAGTRAFAESLASAADASQAVPFPLPIDALTQGGYRLVDDRVLVVLDPERARGYATLFCAKTGENEDQQVGLVVRVGNYVSRLMARRRTMAGEHGEPVEVRGRPAQFFDHRAVWNTEPGTPEFPLLADLAWERDGIFWVLSGDGLTKAELIAAAEALS